MFFNEGKRHMLPRWRSFFETLTTGELTALPQRPPLHVEDDESLKMRLEEWKIYKTTPYASDLVSSAFVLGLDEVSKEAAQHILSPGSESSSMAKAIAERVLGIPSSEVLATQSSWDTPRDKEKFRSAVRILRKRSIYEPRNGILWVDISRNYLMLGLPTHAFRAMKRALSLAPNNRFVLRSATRLFAHLKELDRAHYLLRRSSKILRDPWLLSAEIAVSSLSDKSSSNIKRATSLVREGDLSPLHLTELSSYLATEELTAGNSKGAKRLFKQSLIEPTDNSVAQADWASRRLVDFTLNQKHFKIPRTYEARTLEYYWGENWADALTESKAWLQDEPFSARAFRMATHIAAVGLENYQDAQEFARFGLIANPDDQIIRNNLVFSLASTGMVSEAQEEYSKMKLELMNEATKAVWLATGGLIEFRKGGYSEGRALYNAAISLAESLGHNRLKAMALAYLAREEKNAQNPDYVTILKIADDEASRLKDPGTNAVLKRLKASRTASHTNTI